MVDQIKHDTIARGPEELSSSLAYDRLSAISWRSIFAGLLVSLLTYFTLMALGIAIGGLAITALFEGERSNLPIGSAIWTVVSVLVSLFVGGYFTSRMSRHRTGRVGASQALVVSSVFFSLFLFQIVSFVGPISSGLGQLVSVGANVMSSPQVQAIADDLSANFDLQSPPEEVLQGVVSRLANGNVEGAKNYFARQTGLPPEQVDSFINNFQTNLQNTLQTVTDQVGQTVSIIGWTLFSALLLGSTCCALGGLVGARTNRKKPLDEIERHEVYETRRAA